MLEPTVAPAPKIAATMVRSPRQHKTVYREHTCIAQFLAKLLAILLELALLLWIIGVRGRSALANGQRHISIVGRRGRRLNASFVIDRGHIALWEDTLLACTLIATTPPCINMLALESSSKSHLPNVQSSFICSRTTIRSFCASARSPASVGVYAHIAEAKPKDGGT